MKRLIVVPLIILFSGCASLEWRSVYDEELDQNHLQIKQYSENDEKLGIQTAGMEFKFTVDEYKYPLKLEKFYHLIYMLSKQDENVKDLYHQYSITYQSPFYEVVVEFKESQSMMDVLDFVYSSVQRETPNHIKTDLEDYHWKHINSDRTNMYKLTFSSTPNKKTIGVMIQEFDKKKDSLENYKKSK
jgi:hypothetical protein